MILGRTICMLLNALADSGWDTPVEAVSMLASRNRLKDRWYADTSRATVCRERGRLTTSGHLRSLFDWVMAPMLLEGYRCR